MICLKGIILPSKSPWALPQQTYATVNAAFFEHFKHASKHKLYKTQFESRKKQEKESWADFGDHLMVLVNGVFLCLQDEAQEQLAITQIHG